MMFLGLHDLFKFLETINNSSSRIKKKVVGGWHRGVEGRPIAKYMDRQPQWGKSPSPW